MTHEYPRDSRQMRKTGPKEQPVTVDLVALAGLRGDRLAEHWGTVDLHGLLQQLTA